MRANRGVELWVALIPMREIFDVDLSLAMVLLENISMPDTQITVLTRDSEIGKIVPKY